MIVAPHFTPGWRLTPPFSCIYEYDAEHTIGGIGFKEGDAPNFTGSFYSDTKGMVEKVRVVRKKREDEGGLDPLDVLLCCWVLCVLDTHGNHEEIKSKRHIVK